MKCQGLCGSMTETRHGIQDCQLMSLNHANMPVLKYEKHYTALTADKGDENVDGILFAS